MGLSVSGAVAPSAPLRRGTVSAYGGPTSPAAGSWSDNYDFSGTVDISQGNLSKPSLKPLSGRGNAYAFFRRLGTTKVALFAVRY